MSEQVIIEQIKNGDKNQLASIYKEHHMEFISWITNTYQCSLDEAKDIYQFSILTLYENIMSEKLNELNSTIKTYLFAIGKHKAMEFRKEEKRFAGKPEESLVDVIEVEEWERELKEKNLEAAEQCLEKLGDPCKTLLELYYYHGLSMEEIAEKLQYSNADTTKNLKYKCLNRLRKLFRQELQNTIAQT